MRAARLAALTALAACTYDRPADVGPDGVIVEEVDASIVVSGLWEGAAPITVTLRGSGAPLMTSLPGNGSAPIQALSGIATTVEVEAPPRHTCTTSSPVSLSQDAVIAVTCVGPATLALKTPYEVPIQPDMTELEVSSLVGEADLVITGSGLTRISVDNVDRTIAAEARVPIIDITLSGRAVAVRLEADELSIDTNVMIKPVLPITEVARIVVGGEGERGGRVVAVDKDLIVVGGDLRATTDPTKLAVVVYRLRGSTWTREAELVGPAAGSSYGASIAVSDDTILVGDPTADNTTTPSAGRVYFWQWSAGAWTNTRTLAGQVANGRFGETLAIDGARAAAGSPFGAVNRRGFVQPYVLEGTTWTPQLLIAPANYPDLGLEDDDFFGSSIAIRGDEMLVGASGDDRTGTGSTLGAPGTTVPRQPGANFGSVFQFSGATVGSWLQLADSVATSAMGSAVGFAGDDWLVGVPFWDDGGVADSGLAYVGPSAGRLLSAAPVPLANFGRVVAGTSTAFIIAARNRVRVYARDDAMSYPVLSTLEDPSESTFATGVHMAAGSIVIGVPGDQPTDSGAIVIYR